MEEFDWLEEQERAAGMAEASESDRPKRLAFTIDDCKESPAPKEKKESKRRKMQPPEPPKIHGVATYLTREPDGPNIPITTLTGRRNWIVVEEDIAEEETLSQQQERLNKSKLLQTPISFLLAQIEKEELERDESKPAGRARANADSESPPAPPPSSTELWVQKYAPTAYPELLSDEKTNRSVLQWIKEWDAVVFGKKPVKPKSKQQKGAARAASGDPRPEKRVLLLHGPPGAGKTTLAHVLAHQAGYRPVEINASDDRSSAAFFRKVVPALENESVDNGKPNLIVVDEIDGALGTEGTGAIDSLLQIVEFEPGVSEKKKKKTRAGADGEGPVSVDGPARRLGRPIICICNDLYAPALRKLRDHALVFRVEKPESTRLLARLREVCKGEGLSADTKSLLALIDLTEADIRACLNTLQFIRKTSMVLTPDHLISSRFGSKDIQHSIFQVWSSIFRKTRKNTALQDLLNEKMREKRALEIVGVKKAHPVLDTEQLESSQLFELVSLHSDRAKVLEGCHVNYPTMKLSEPVLERMVACADWLVYEDTLESKAYVDHSSGLQKYAATTALAFHHLAASASYQPKFEYPKQEGEMRGKQSTHRGLITHMSNPRGSGASKLPASAVSLELLSPLIDIVSPSIRPVNMAVLSALEKQIVQGVVEVMAAFQLSYKSSDQGWKLDPEIDKLIRFAGAVYKHHVLTEAQKEHLNREVEMFTIRLHELRMGPVPALLPVADSGPTPASPVKDQAAVTSPTKNQLSSPTKKQATPSKVPAFKPKEDIKQQIIANSQKLIGTAAAVDAPKDFFGRPILPVATASAPSSAHMSSAVTQKPPKAPVTFKFQEGFTNAVRRNVYMRDFL